MVVGRWSLALEWRTSESRAVSKKFSEWLVGNTDDYRRALEQFRDFRVSLEDLRNVSVGIIDFDFDSNASDLYTRKIVKHTDPLEPAVPVSRGNVRRAFELYQAGSIDQKTLADWASMFLLNDDFDIEDEETVVEWLNYVAMGETPTNPSPN